MKNIYSILMGSKVQFQKGFGLSRAIKKSYLIDLAITQNELQSEKVRYNYILWGNLNANSGKISTSHTILSSSRV